VPTKPTANNREPTILGKLNSLTSFDYLGMRNQTNKQFVKLNGVLSKYGENLNSKTIFTEQIMQIDPKMNKTKRILVVTEQNLYCLRENFTTKLQLGLKNVTKMFLIKNNSSVMAISQARDQSNEVEILVESVKRTELLFFILNQMETYGLPKPKVLYSSTILVNKATDQRKSSRPADEGLVHIDFDPKRKEGLSKKNQKLFSQLLSTNFLNAYHVSNLEVYSKGLFGNSNWDKRLCVLSNIGLLIFTKAEEKNPRLFPTIDATLQAVGP
jgi:hypothetical protein